MKFYVSDFDEYRGYLYLLSEDEEHEVAVDVDEYYDITAETWQSERVRQRAAEVLVERFGPDAWLEWEE